jgi:hypothetical protein
MARGYVLKGVCGMDGVQRSGANGTLQERRPFRHYRQHGIQHAAGEGQGKAYQRLFGVGDHEEENKGSGVRQEVDEQVAFVGGGPQCDGETQGEEKWR